MSGRDGKNGRFWVLTLCTPRYTLWGMRTLRLIAHYFLIVGILVGLVLAFSALFAWARVALPPSVTGAIWAVEVLADWGTTILLLRAGLGIHEANPVHAFLFKKVSYAGDFLLICAFLGAILVFVWPGVPPTYQLGVCCAYTAVYVNNGLIYSRRLGAKHRAEHYVNLAVRSATKEP